MGRNREDILRTSGIRQVRVSRHTALWVGLSGLSLWGLSAYLWTYRGTAGLGIGVGVLAGGVRWWLLQRRIERRDRRYERNKIFVHYLGVIEVLVSVVAYNAYLAIPIALVLLVLSLLTAFSIYSWLIALSTFMGGAAICLTVLVLVYECRYGAVYYQYNTADWSGTEGLIYDVGEVVEPLEPSGKVSLQGALWNAVSISGEAVPSGASVEVLAVERLTLYVDYLSPADSSHDG